MISFTRVFFDWILTLLLNLPGCKTNIKHNWLKKNAEKLYFFEIFTSGQNALLLLIGRLIREFFLEPINRELGGTTV